MWWSNGLLAGARRPGRTGRARGGPPSPCRPRCRRPGPSGPVVVSTPRVCPCSGWPGVSEPHCRSDLQVVELQAVAGEVELDVEGQAGVPAGEHEPVAARPVRVGRVVPHHPVEQQVGGGREAHGGARVAVAGLLHGVHGQHAGGVDGRRSSSDQFSALRSAGARRSVVVTSGVFPRWRLDRARVAGDGRSPPTLPMSAGRCSGTRGVRPRRAPRSGALAARARRGCRERARAARAGDGTVDSVVDYYPLGACVGADCRQVGTVCSWQEAPHSRGGRAVTSGVLAARIRRVAE